MKAVCDTLLDQQSAACTAHLPLVEPDRVNQTFDRAVDIGVIKDDIGGFAAQFQCQRLTHRGSANFAADFG